MEQVRSHRSAVSETVHGPEWKCSGTSQVGNPVSERSFDEDWAVASTGGVLCGSLWWRMDPAAMRSPAVMGEELHRHGHQVVLGITTNLVTFGEKVGLTTHPVGPDSQKSMESLLGQRWPTAGVAAALTPRVSTAPTLSSPDPSPDSARLRRPSARNPLGLPDAPMRLELCGSQKLQQHAGHTASRPCSRAQPQQSVVARHASTEP